MSATISIGFSNISKDTLLYHYAGLLLVKDSITPYSVEVLMQAV